MTSEKDIQKIIIREKFHNRNDFKVIIPNIYFFAWESDLLAIDRNNNFTTEFEIKCSRFDYLQDFKKADKHKALSEQRDITAIPNYFYYVLSEEIAQKEIPECDYAGLIIVCKSGMNKYLNTIKKAPLLHSESMPMYKWEEIAIKLNHRLL